jgi:hypothetical protein
VRINQARQDEFAAKIDNFSFGCAEWQDFLVGAESKNPSAANGNGALNGERIIDRGDLCVVQNEVRKIGSD